MTPEQRQAARARCDECYTKYPDDPDTVCCKTTLAALDEIERLEDLQYKAAKQCVELAVENERLRAGLEDFANNWDDITAAAARKYLDAALGRPDEPFGKAEQLEGD